MSLANYGSTSWRYFELSEFDCTHTGKNLIDFGFVAQLDELRHRCRFPFKITSGYRDASHPAEVDKAEPGQHYKGVAADIAVADGQQRRSIVEEAMKMGFRGIGVAKDFVHVDMREGPAVLWTY